MNGNWRSGRSFVEFFIKVLEHPCGFLAAWNAKIETRLSLARECVGIVMAIVATLPAILLRHSRHHPTSQRTAFSKLHALIDRHGLIVPGRLTIVTVAGALHDGSALLR